MGLVDDSLTIQSQVCNGKPAMDGEFYAKTLLANLFDKHEFKVPWTRCKCFVEIKREWDVITRSNIHIILLRPIKTSRINV